MHLPAVGDVEHDPTLGARSGEAEHPEAQACPDTDAERRLALEAPSENDVTERRVAPNVCHVVAAGAGIVQVAELVEEFALRTTRTIAFPATDGRRPSPSLRSSDTYSTR
jgi:hypothetical protein